jgi:protein-disulfide isomerase
MQRSTAVSFSFRRNLSAGFLAGFAAVVLLVATAHAQFSAAQTTAAKTTQVKDASVLRPPQGARVAIVEFSDLECPDCSRANPVLKAAVAKYHIPWIRYDFPLSYHPWSTEAAINARWFDTKGKGLGDEYRDQVFANQSTFYYDVAGFRQFTQKFAQSHGIAMPFAVDPQGKFAAEVKADYELGQRIGIDHTPTIWVVTSGSKGAPYIEVTDRSKLYQIIDQALADTKSQADTKPKVETKPKANTKTK